MKCESCKRDNIIKSYCYFSHRQKFFEYVTGEQFTAENFVEYAVEMQLRCRLVIYCSDLTKADIWRYWGIIKPVLKEILQRPKSLEDS